MHLNPISICVVLESINLDSDMNSSATWSPGGDQVKTKRDTILLFNLCASGLGLCLSSELRVGSNNSLPPTRRGGAHSSYLVHFFWQCLCHHFHPYELFHSVVSSCGALLVFNYTRYPYASSLSETLDSFWNIWYFGCHIEQHTLSESKKVPSRTASFMTFVTHFYDRYVLGFRCRQCNSLL